MEPLPHNIPYKNQQNYIITIINYNVPDAYAIYTNEYSNPAYIFIALSNKHSYISPELLELVIIFVARISPLESLPLI